MLSISDSARRGLQTASLRTRRTRSVLHGCGSLLVGHRHRRRGRSLLQLRRLLARRPLLRCGSARLRVDILELSRVQRKSYGTLGGTTKKLCQSAESDSTDKPTPRAAAARTSFVRRTSIIAPNRPSVHTTTRASSAGAEQGAGGCGRGRREHGGRSATIFIRVPTRYDGRSRSRAPTPPRPRPK